MKAHFNEAIKKAIFDRNSDTFADHFAQHLKTIKKPKAKDVRELIDFNIIWQGNAISLSKTFGKSTCKLCMVERMTIMNRFRSSPRSLINRCSEIYGSCRHKPRFHRFTSDTD